MEGLAQQLDLLLVRRQRQGRGDGGELLLRRPLAARDVLGILGPPLPRVLVPPVLGGVVVGPHEEQGDLVANVHQLPLLGVAVLGHVGLGLVGAVVDADALPVDDLLDLPAHVAVAVEGVGHPGEAAGQEVAEDVEEAPDVVAAAVIAALVDAEGGVHGRAAEVGLGPLGAEAAPGVGTAAAGGAVPRLVPRPLFRGRLLVATAQTRRGHDEALGQAEVDELEGPVGGGRPRSDAVGRLDVAVDAADGVHRLDEGQHDVGRQVHGVLRAEAAGGVGAGQRDGRRGWRGRGRRGGR
mmetsp:Transcript_11583/g.32899  ORF Transcript_11583/g.32899 Transcript_11583/m.32899 type:complete len:295 (-) Transcript_11583:558-1442(-)